MHEGGAMPTITNDGLLVVSELLGIQTLPLVLGIRPQQDSVDAWNAARQQALANLRKTGLVDSYGEIDSELTAALRILSKPERELVARIHTTLGTRRICLSRQGSSHALVVRIGNSIEVTTAWADGSGAALARPVLEVLGPNWPADVTSFSAPADELRDRLDRSRVSSDYAQIPRSLGVGDREAVDFGMAMSSCFACAEIIACSYEFGRITLSAGGVAVYDTERGRIVASPGTSPDMRVWSTFTPGTDHRIAQAISALVESLPGGRWMP